MIKSNGINSLLEDEKTIDFFLKAFLEYQNFPVYSTGFTVVDFDQANHNGKIDNERFDYLYVEYFLQWIINLINNYFKYSISNNDRFCISELYEKFTMVKTKEDVDNVFSGRSSLFTKKTNDFVMRNKPNSINHLYFSSNFINNKRFNYRLFLNPHVYCVDFIVQKLIGKCNEKSIYYKISVNNDISSSNKIMIHCDRDDADTFISMLEEIKRDYHLDDLFYKPPFLANSINDWVSCGDEGSLERNELQMMNGLHQTVYDYLADENNVMVRFILLGNICDSIEKEYPSLKYKRILISSALCENFDDIMNSFKTNTLRNIDIKGEGFNITINSRYYISAIKECIRYLQKYESDFKEKIVSNTLGNRDLSEQSISGGKTILKTVAQ